MSLTGNNILGGASGQTTGYDIENSLRLNDDDSAYLSFTSSATPTDSTKATLSCWFKLGSGANFSTDMTTWAYRTIVGWGHSTDGRTSIGLHDQSVNGGLPCIAIKSTDSGGSMYFNYLSNAVIRDFSSWYHLVVVWDGSIGTAVNRIKAYLNGTELTWSTSSNSQSDFYISGRGMPVATVGSNYGGSYQGHWDGYIAETHWVDGQACTPEAFAETNSATNQWQAIKYTGSYGTNGFYLKFQDSSALGDDSSGNTNDFTATNLVATDQVLDSPTNNFATWNPLAISGTTANVFTEGNLKSANGTAFGGIPTIGLGDSGKWYAEFLATSTGTDRCVGLQSNLQTAFSNYNPGRYAGSYSYDDDGQTYETNSGSSYGATYTTGDIIGVAADLTNNKLYFSKNGTWQNSGVPTSGATGTGAISISSTPADGYFFGVGDRTNNATWYANFGSDSSFAGSKTAQGNQDGNGIGDFYYTPPTGYKALNTSNLPDPAIALPTAHFNTVLYAGTGSTNAITGVGFATDMVWNKSRSATLEHHLFDTVRGATKYFSVSTTDAEATDANSLTTFGSDGFTVGSSATDNQTSGTYVSWNWKAGGTAVSNGDGSITSSVSANTTAGFSIVSYTGHGSTTGTVGHGLGVKPDLIITKYRSGAASWAVYNSRQGATKVIFLDDTSAEGTGITYWRDTEPTASVFSVGASGTTGGNANPYIAYCFASIEGYSKVGSYTGNGSTDGVFVHTGSIQPIFVMLKDTSSAEDWVIHDTTRAPYNQSQKVLYPNTSGAEEDSSNRAIDIVSNGFKARNNGGRTNRNGDTYIYYAVGYPFKTSNAR